MRCTCGAALRVPRTGAGGPEHGCYAAESGEINNLGREGKGRKREGQGREKGGKREGKGR